MLRFLSRSHNSLHHNANATVVQVFALLVFEMSLFGLLIVPLPYTMKRRLFNFISENPLVAKLQYGMKVGLQ